MALFFRLSSSGTALSRSIYGRKKCTIAVAMSGGVDSSVTAAILKEQGYDVVGVFMKNWDFSDEKGEYQCTYTSDRKHMEDVCDYLKIPSVNVEFSTQYWNEVFVPFLNAYQSGLTTPNPDVYCNRYVKFHHFKNFIQEKLGIKDIATGHYARVDHGKSDKVRLLKARDEKKDQTYFLAMTSGKSFENIHFPIGHLTKEQVKDYAKLHLPHFHLHEKKESMGICFIGKRKMQDFLSQYLQFTPGRFLEMETGKVLGTHDKQEYYTIGQGAKIGGISNRYFILEKITTDNLPFRQLRYSYPLKPGDILVGMGQDHPALFSSRLTVLNNSFNWIGGSIPPAMRDASGMAVHCKVRHSPRSHSCIAKASLNDRGEEVLEIRFDSPLRAVTPGQILVLYDGEECLGGAPIPVL